MSSITSDVLSENKKNTDEIQDLKEVSLFICFLNYIILSTCF